ncbi:type II toxin-antitoxin system PemK/MazF family toxin [Acidithiobacillus sp. IBUN Pt1247-S3]|uniref:type II toxin-antitoxin system PemK/MazF family toxin n=1 Tax=Acidithiobacillus sp. IBUN Pt1247-S3 TaxID=3166642 RepID=UPI0034E39AE6
MGNCKAWDVVKVPFPYTNRPVQQYRPALVIATIDGSDSPHLLWVLMITSAENRGWAGDVSISDLDSAGLPVPSVVRTVKIATIDQDMAETLGHLSLPDRQQVADMVRKHLVVAGM